MLFVSEDFERSFLVIRLPVSHGTANSKANSLGKELVERLLVLYTPDYSGVGA